MKTCIECGHAVERIRRGLCRSCYHRHRRAGDLESAALPPSARGGVEMLDADDVRRLVAQGMTDEQIGREFGAVKDTVRRTRKRHGIPPARPANVSALEAAAAVRKHTRSLVDKQPASLTIDEERLALCAQADPEAWFPEQGQSARPAKAICAQCPLTKREDGGNGRCLEVALANREAFGIWAGTNEKERRAMLEPRAVAS